MKLSVLRKIKIISLVLTFFIVINCGDEKKFKSATSSNEPPPSLTPDVNPTLPPSANDEPADSNTDSLIWLWNCEDANTIQDTSSPSDDLSDLIISGSGDFEMERDKIDKHPLEIVAKPCELKNKKRDIVFVIDVSGSMTKSTGGLFAPVRPASDPMLAGRCARLDAIETVISQFAGQDDIRFGIVTFSGDNNAINQSSGLFQSKEDLFNDISGGSNIADILCAGLDSTNYDSGLASGGALLNLNSLAETSKEIYFISDGEPDPIDKNGVDIARTLRNNITIITIMLNGADDSILHDYIASKDENGFALHARVEHTSELAGVLADLSRNKIIGGKFSYRPIGSSNWTDKNIITYFKDGEFKFKPLMINYDIAPDGLEVIYKYWDKFNNIWEGHGKILWKE